ncbi:hypothetical protein [Mycoplasmopsis cynos]|uniref:hypothetical protein n=1 Tax=Mycoplasmopsis cynos TaxID=171284 RepID=UPI0022088D0D|nr:hypothetical protein [Mycoplasmopsis cynos]UWV92373.1 hypothetical protein NWE57_05955 [Mycoplasmopsis cynos]
MLQDVIGDRAVVQPPKQNAQNKNQQNTTEDTSTVNAKYKELVNINNEARKQNNLINRNIGIGNLTTVGFLGSIVNAISLVRIISQRKPKQYKRLSILLLIAFWYIINYWISFTNFRNERNITWKKIQRLHQYLIILLKFQENILTNKNNFII